MSPIMPADDQYIVKRKNTWYVRVRVPPSLRHLYGDHVLRSLTTKNKAEAQERRHRVVADIKDDFKLAKVNGAKREAEKLKGVPSREYVKRIQHLQTTKGDLYAEEVVLRNHDMYTDLDHGEKEWFAAENFDAKTESRYKHSIKLLRDHLADLKEPQAVQFVTSAVAMGLRDKLVAKGLHRRTIDSYLSALRSRWRHWADMKLVAENPWRDVKMPKLRKGVEPPVRDWSDGELIKLFTGRCSPALFNLMALLLLTGCRRDEVVNLAGEDYEDGWLRIRRGKNPNAVRRVPVHAILQRPLKGKTGPLFKGSGNAWTQKFMRYRRSIGLSGDDTNLHSLRHAFSTLASNAGVELHKIQAVIGHARGNSTTSKTYIHVSDEVRCEVVDTVADNLPAEVMKAIRSRFSV